ncbi:hypothetical protein FOZ62_007107 [Perkinsus olseni]|uniref:GYF domain-containing protein n=2 Tax=Perkinsus olseni TaxID=32597 RepID=A0A7J6RJM9_PEROL|nr:hypothetical protein FOZ62_007107 [Perkinsus olseni]
MAANAHMQQQAQHQAAAQQQHAAAAAAAAAAQQNAMFQQQQQQQHAGLIWYYIDDVGNIQGPFTKAELAGWYCNRWLSEQLMVCKSLSWPNPQTSHFAPLRDYLHEIFN